MSDLTCDEVVAIAYLQGQADALQNGMMADQIRVLHRGCVGNSEARAAHVRLLAAAKGYRAWTKADTSAAIDEAIKESIALLFPKEADHDR
jgi:hypothetical protein